MWLFLVMFDFSYWIVKKYRQISHLYRKTVVSIIAKSIIKCEHTKLSRQSTILVPLYLN